MHIVLVYRYYNDGMVYYNLTFCTRKSLMTDLGLCSRLGVELQCPHCYSNNIIKSGKSSTGKQRYRCKHCQKRFITDYTYKAYLPNSDTKITQLTKEGLGIRSTARILGISLPPCLRRFCR